MKRAPLPFAPLSPMNDFVFKVLMGNPKHVGILTAFLQSVLDIPPDEYGSISIIDPVIGSDYPDGKTGILDVKVKTKSGRVIDVEIQVEFQDTLPQRILFYSARMITEQIGKGENYEQIKQVVNIVITAHKVFKDEAAYHHCFIPYDQKNNLVYPGRLMEIHFLELPKIPSRDDSTAVWPWLRFFSAETKGELQMAAKREPQVAKAIEVLVDLSGDIVARHRAENQEKFRRDMASRISYARREGIEEGIEKGMDKGIEKGKREMALEIARNALSKNYPVEEVAELSGLSVKEVLTLKRKLK